MKLRPDQLAADAARSLRPVYVVSGDEPLLVNECADVLRGACRDAGFSERIALTVDRSFDWRDLDAEASGMSLFAEQRLLELRLASAKPGKKGAEALLRYAERPAADTVLLVLAPRMDKTTLKSAWATALEASGVLVQVWPIDDAELPAWVNQRMRARELEPERDAVLAFCARIEGNLLAAQQEIDKLWLNQGPGPVTTADIQERVGDNARFNVFKLVDTALAGHARKAFRVLRSLRIEGAEPVLILWALTRELRTLYALRHAMDAGNDVTSALKRARVWGARQGLVRAAVGRHSTDSLADLLKAAAAADSAAKGRSKIGVWDHLTGLVYALAGSAGQYSRGAA